MKKSFPTVFIAAMVLLLAVGGRAQTANAQLKDVSKLVQLPSCRQLWDEASAEAAKAAMARAKVEAGAAPEAPAARWSELWTNSWQGACRSGGPALRLSGQNDCCHTDWFELASLTGKSAWSTAWESAPRLTGTARAWSEKFASAYADEWAKVWFLHFPWL